jgi:RNA polymerase sigma factor (sigma-70 family)
MKVKKDSQELTELLEACRRGDLNAHRRVYELYVKAMLNTAFRILNQVEDAEDVVQEAFVKAFRKLPGFRGESSFGAWLKRIVVNQAINHLHARRVEWVSWDEKRKQEVEREPLSPEIDLPYTAEDARQALQQLPDGYRTIFSLYLLEGYDHTEIAEIMGISVSTSLSQYHRAKKKLKEILLTKKRHGQNRAIV